MTDPRLANGEPITNGRGWREKASDWLFSQGVSTVLLVAILAAIAYALNTMIPAQIKTIQDGYDRQRSDFRETVKEQRTDFTEALKQQRSDTERSMEEMTTRIERAIERNGT